MSNDVVRVGMIVRVSQDARIEQDRRAVWVGEYVRVMEYWPSTRLLRVEVLDDCEKSIILNVDEVELQSD